jgi:hypothetical protein
MKKPLKCVLSFCSNSEKAVIPGKANPMTPECGERSPDPAWRAFPPATSARAAIRFAFSAPARKVAAGDGRLK